MSTNRLDKRAPRNRTLTVSASEIAAYQQRLGHLQGPAQRRDLENTVIHQDLLTILDWLPTACVDLLILDPPYNLTKTFNTTEFREQSGEEYAAWFTAWLVPLLRVLKPTASVYVCSDWRSSLTIGPLLARHLILRNRITWEREKGRGALTNWKNCAEDIWFCTVSDHYTFNLDAVKLKRRVLAPYTDDRGRPKDWQRDETGDYRLTHPSNMWTDLTVPFWSMPENTDHPTQKPEKLIAKLILASSNAGDMVFDPFLGSGTTAVVAKKLNRYYSGVEIDEEYCCLAQKRLDHVTDDSGIQGYHDGVFWERNTTPGPPTATKKRQQAEPLPLFGTGLVEEGP